MCFNLCVTVNLNSKSTILILLFEEEKSAVFQVSAVIHFDLKTMVYGRFCYTENSLRYRTKTFILHIYPLFIYETECLYWILYKSCVSYCVILRNLLSNVKIWIRICKTFVNDWVYLYDCLQRNC